MPLKKFDKFLPSERCEFCKLNEIDVLYGPIYKCKLKSKMIVVHYFCLLLASKIEQNGRDNQGILGFFPRDIGKELKRGSSIACTYCGKNGATVHCIHKNCNQLFHLPCGVAKGSVHQFFNQFDSYCHSHRPKQNISPNILLSMKDTCVICSLHIDKRNKYGGLWPTCCKASVLLHRKCIQIMAINAGYYFKCPLCNNTDIFKAEMQRLGIYIPEQEASWETEPHAYEELLVRGSGCEAKECSCPRGRLFSSNNCAWQIELCKVCGGNGVHLNCSGKWDKKLGYQFNWFCEICKPVFLENKASETPERVADANNEDEPETRVSFEGTNGNSNLSSASSEKAIDIAELRSLISPSSGFPTSNSVNSQPLVNELNHNKESDDEDVIVISESEATTDHSKKQSGEAPPQSQATNDHSSDDDCQIVGIVTPKRKKRGQIMNRKRFRTAPWAPTGLVRTSVSELSPVNTSSSSKTFVGSISNLEKESRSDLYNPNKEEHSPSNSAATDEKIFFVQSSKAAQLNQLISSDSLLDQQKGAGIHYSLSSKKQRTSFLEKNEGVSLPSNIGLNFSEVSINKIVSKSSLQGVKLTEANQIIDLSLDEEQLVFQTQSGVAQNQKNECCFGQTEIVANKAVQLNHTLYKPHDSQCSTSLKNLDKRFGAQINIFEPGPSKVSQEIANKREANKLSSKLLNQPAVVHIILSSDDEEETASKSSSLPSSNSIKLDNSSTFKTENVSSFHSTDRTAQQQIKMSNTPIVESHKSHEINAIELSMKKEGSLLKQKEITSAFDKSLNAKRVRNKPEQAFSGGSILQTVLSNIGKIRKEPLIKPDVLIVPDDDDEDEVKLEAIHCVKNIFTSEKKLIDCLGDEPVPTKVFLSEDLCSDNEDVNQSPESPTEIIAVESALQTPLSSVENNSNSWCITGVMTLSAPICFDILDSDSSNEGSKTVSIEGSVKTQSLPAKCEQTESMLTNENKIVVATERKISVPSTKQDSDCFDSLITRVDGNKDSIKKTSPAIFCNSTSSHSKLERTNSNEDSKINYNRCTNMNCENEKDSIERPSMKSKSNLGSEEIVSSTDSSSETGVSRLFQSQLTGDELHSSYFDNEPLKEPSSVTASKCEESVSSTTDVSFSTNMLNND